MTIKNFNFNVLSVLISKFFLKTSPFKGDTAHFFDLKKTKKFKKMLCALSFFNKHFYKFDKNAQNFKSKANLPHAYKN